MVSSALAFSLSMTSRPARMTTRVPVFTDFLVCLIGDVGGCDQDAELAVAEPRDEPTCVFQAYARSDSKLTTFIGNAVPAVSGSGRDSPSVDHLIGHAAGTTF
jgi:hypothetical protein